MGCCTGRGRGPAHAGLLTRRGGAARGGDHADLLDALLHAHEDGRALTERQLVFELSALVFAAHETTATSLTWAIGLLAAHPEVHARVLAELETVPLPRVPTPKQLRTRPFLSQVIDETLRLYPPLYVISRQALAPDRLGDLDVPGGTRVLIHILGLHRDRRHWAQPDHFDPDRFSTTRATHPRTAFQPFLSGPRRCLGAPLAMAELQLILPMLLRRFRFELVDGLPRPECGAVLQPDGGLPVVIHRREVSDA